MLKRLKRSALLAIAVALSAFALPKKENYSLVFIGDSITQANAVENNAVNSPPAQAAAFLKDSGKFGNIQFSNQGRSGRTTLDFLPLTGKMYPNVITAADAFYRDKSATLLFSIMIGTNDSAVKGPNGAPVSAENYQKNLMEIADSLFTRYPGCKMVFHQPIWYSDSTRNTSTYLVEGRKRLQSYTPQLKRLVEHYKAARPGQVFFGDTKAYGYFKKHYLTAMKTEKGPAGTFYLHPNKEGSAKLGKFWAKALMAVL
ncbi:GDSL-type esterase/lipase family protein [Hufsiella ginkgonis]|uniref:Lipolytic protein G-D-S-L family n=1 Tax=Hufsiella ginkgonis TaxID=2695274 RepID=A0A7K1XSV2_9SPHI|nr:GDSL-type esterase/lipase family protein [Hufsiella ginkgonis]MXV14083.1 lipolytic protein G-D-S-L family [Hufsiella ginkgonis]